MEKLKIRDLVLVLTAEGGRIELNDRHKMRELWSRKRLEQAGLIDKNGYLTGSGLQKAETLQKLEKAMQKGIPYKQVADMREDILDGEWATGIYKVRTFVAEEQFFIAFGHPEKEMKARKKSAAELQVIADFIERADQGMKKSIQVWPHTDQIEKIGGLRITWFSNEEQTMFIPVQSKYVEYTLLKAGKDVDAVKFFLNPVGTDTLCIRAYIIPARILAMIGLIRKSSLKWDDPKPREGWSGKKD